MEEIKQIKELTKKSHLDQGDTHVIYPLQGDPTKIVKAAYAGEGKNIRLVPINKEFWEEFASLKDICARVYKISDKYVIMDKLDTEKTINDTKVLANQMKSIFPTSYTWMHNPNIVLEYIYRMVRMREIALIQEIMSRLKQKGLFNSYVTFFIRVDNRLDREVDIHKGQIGYDKFGNLKLMDY